ncbi:MAG: hypothetical protein IPO83_07450 [Chitinophagaceae bacterium]|nr:hypothetical protein [Chitinophagaceae bacterium]
MRNICLVNKIVVALVLLTGKVFSQGTSHLVMHVFPANAIVILDTAHVPLKGIIDVPAGTHIIKSWAPQRILSVDTIETFADSTQVYINNIPYDPAYLAVLKAKSAQKAKAVVPLISTGAVLLVSSASLIAMNSQINKYYDQAETARTNYEAAITPSQLQYYQDQYNEYAHQYEQMVDVSNLAAATSAVLVAGGIATTLYILFKNRPDYVEEQLLSRINPGFMIGSTGMVGSIVYKF